MMPLGKAGSPQDTLTEVVVSSLKWMKLGALGAGTQRESEAQRKTLVELKGLPTHRRLTPAWFEWAKITAKEGFYRGDCAGLHPGCSLLCKGFYFSYNLMSHLKNV